MVAMAAVTATLEAIENDSMLNNVRAVESHFRNLMAEIPQISKVRGLGFLLGIEFKYKAAPIHKGLLERKVITGTSSDPNVLRLLPALCLHASAMDLFASELKSVLDSLGSETEA